MAIVVTGCGRSGTLYIASVFRALAIPTSHEQIFVPDRREPPRDMRGFQAASSWLAAPFVGALPEPGLVLHQLRDPRDVIASLLGIRFFRPLRPFPLLAGAGDAVELGRRAVFGSGRRAIRNDYVRFIEWADPEILVGREIDRCIRYWIRWNRMIERRAPSDAYLRYRVEDLDVALLASVFERAGVERGTSEIEDALAGVPRTVNTRRRDDRAIDRLAQRPSFPDLVAAARDYGYGLDG
jgi:hypothetical protein